MDAAAQSFSSKKAWQLEWDRPGSFWRRSDVGSFRVLAERLEPVFAGQGFRLFGNGGAPLFLRLSRDLREEVLLLPTPYMRSRANLPFSIFVHLSSSEVAKIRTRYWRSSVRPPSVIASGNLGQFEPIPTHYIFSGELGEACANLVSLICKDFVFPWLEIFDDPYRMRDDLLDGRVPLIDESTAVELLLAYFDPHEARQFLQVKGRYACSDGNPVLQPNGYELEADRVDPIREYYRLGAR